VSVFTITSTKLRVTDPCYEKDVWCSGVLENVLPGQWVADKVVASDSQTGGWGDRISELQISHIDYHGVVDVNEPAAFTVGVDSGQAGFFDELMYPEGPVGEYGDLETFYGKVCQGTQGNSYMWEERLYDESTVERLIDATDQANQQIVDDLKNITVTKSGYDYLGIANVGFGVATHSGFGDGGYSCYVGRNDQGQIVAARIVFIGDDDEENDW
jgi:hypothetical protein